jgi:integrase
MASISRDPNGRRRIIFVGHDRIRRAIYLGKFPQKATETIQRHVEAIVSSLNSRSPLDADTAEWLGKLGDDLHAKLVAVHLVAPRQTALPAGATTLKALVDGFNASKLKAKPSTRVSWGHTQRNLITLFGESKDVAKITEADAERWAEWIEVDQELSAPTIRRRCGYAKQFFAFGKKSRLIPSNPFAELKSGNLANRERDHFISREDAEAVLEKCPDVEWRLLFALSRYGGLRCPSEHLSLRWDDVDLPRGLMRVISPKTEHHQGGESRLIPIFPELRPFLQDAWDQAEDGAEWVVAKRRDSAANLRTTMVKIIRRAGLEPWPKLFHNLRATRQTELEESFPSHVVCAWIGNSEKVARKHYLQVTEAHFAKAQNIGTARHTAQQQPEMCRKPEGRKIATNTKPPGITAEYAAISGVFENQTMGDEGLEPPTSTV